MKNRRKIWAVLTAVAILLTACGSFSKSNVSTASELIMDDSSIVIGFSQVGSESLWRTANSTSIQESFTKDEGFFLNFMNARQKQENQIKSIREFISRRVDYIMFSPVTETGWEKVLQEAKDAGIPVILVDRKVDVEDDSLYTCWLGSNMVSEGKNAALWLKKNRDSLLGDRKQINIVVLTGTEGASATIERSEGFHEIADQESDWNILEEISADFTTSKGKEVMTQLLKKYPEIDVVVSQNDDMTFGAIEAMKEAGRSYGSEGEIKIISFDATKSALAMVQEGIISLDVECNPLQGDYLKNIIRKMEDGFTVHKYNFVDEELFTIDNVPKDLSTRMY